MNTWAFLHLFFFGSEFDNGKVKENKFDIGKVKEDEEKNIDKMKLGEK